MNGHIITAGKAWLRHLEALKMSPATVAVRADSLKQFNRFLKSLGITCRQDVRADHLEQWRRQMFKRHLKPATVEQRLRSVRQFFNFLMERGGVFENPAGRLRMHRRPTPLPEVPTVKQVERILDQPDTDRPGGIRDRALLETMYGAGLRLGEAARMNTVDLDPGNALLLVHGKGAKERMLPLGTVCVNWLNRYLVDARHVLLGDREDCDQLWLNSYGRPMTRQVLMNTVKKHARAAGLARFSSHSLRRAAATHMLANGACPLTVQEFLGHATSRHLQRYLRVTANELKRMHADSLPGS